MKSNHHSPRTRHNLTLTHNPSSLTNPHSLHALKRTSKHANPTPRIAQPSKNSASLSPGKNTTFPLGEVQPKPAPRAHSPTRLQVHPNPTPQWGVRTRETESGEKRKGWGVFS